MDSQLPAFKEKNPQLEVVTELIRGQHPHLKGFYSNSLTLSQLLVVNSYNLQGVLTLGFPVFLHFHRKQ